MPYRVPFVLISSSILWIARSPVPVGFSGQTRSLDHSFNTRNAFPFQEYRQNSAVVPDAGWAFSDFINLELGTPNEVNAHR